MAGRGGSRWRTATVVTGMLSLTITVAVIAVTWWVKGYQAAVDVAGLVGVVLAFPPLVVGLVAWQRSARIAVPPGTAEVLRAKDVLAGLVAEQWRAEAVLRSLDDPDPIPVRWRVTAQAKVMDQPANLTPGALVEGSSDAIAELAAGFRAMGRRRLVITGGPGSGKTTLAVQLLRHLLDTREQHKGEPVPVLVSLAGWDTDRFPRLTEWIAAELEHGYPALRAVELGQDMPQRLASRGHILPVLDGLDELPEPARAAVIAALNRFLAGSDQLILTSRTGEYAKAVTAAHGVLTSTLVIEPDPLDPPVAADYLQRCLPPGHHPAWTQILTALRATTPTSSAGAVLGEVTATPLGLWLLRTVYLAPDADPAPLLDQARFPTATALRAHLFDHLINALITTRPPSNDPAELFRPRRRHDPTQVKHWLSYLARHLTQQPTTTASGPSTRDFAWWQLAATTHAITALTVGLPIGLAVGIVGGLAVGLSNGPLFGLANGLLGGLAYGFAFGSVVGLVVGLGARSWARHSPGYANLRIRQRSAELLRNLTGGLVLGLAFGLECGLALAFGSVVVHAFGFVTLFMYVAVGGLMLGLTGKLVLGLIAEYGHAFRPTAGLVGGFVSGLLVVLVVVLVIQLVGGLANGLVTPFIMYGLALGLAAGLAAGFVAWVETPAQTHHTTTPMGNWHTDRTLNLVRISTNALAGGLVYGLDHGLTIGLVLVLGLAAGPVYALIFGLAVGLGFGEHRAWPAYLVATWRLARAGQLPRRLMSFLDDCHRLGLLRAVGPIYQFRHAELQDHLAAAYRTREHANER